MVAVKATSADAYQLMHRGALALSHVESVGMRVDERRLDKSINRVGKKIKSLEDKLKEDIVYKKWRRVFAEKTNLGSREQLATIIFDVIDYPCRNRGAKSAKHPKGKPKADEAAFDHLDVPFIKEYLEVEKLKKLKGTYLTGLKRELVDGYIHPFFNLHTTRTFRGSSSEINFQNIPIRNPMIGKIIRSCFIPRIGHQIVEIDYAGIEVRIAACYHKDPTMIRYINDETRDMHRDMAAQIYCIKEDWVSKQARYAAKNMFVFPQFYGDYYINCARAMWEAIDRSKIEVPDGRSVKELLAKKGIKKLGKCDPDKKPVPGTFEHHMHEVEQHFWNVRFPIYTSWKKKWYNAYRTKGSFKTFTGFEISGLYSRNDVLNYPIQGCAFHCLLWSLIQLQKWLLKNNMRSRIVGQIHDSLVLDIHPDELMVVLHKAKYFMTKKLLETWDWITVPLKIEAEVSPVDASWYEKETISF